MVMVKVKRIKDYYVYYAKLSRDANPQTSCSVGGCAAIATRRAQLLLPTQGFTARTYMLQHYSSGYAFQRVF